MCVPATVGRFQTAQEYLAASERGFWAAEMTQYQAQTELQRDRMTQLRLQSQGYNESTVRRALAERNARITLAKIHNNSYHGLRNVAGTTVSNSAQLQADAIRQNGKNQANLVRQQIQRKIFTHTDQSLYRYGRTLDNALSQALQSSQYRQQAQQLLSPLGLGTAFFRDSSTLLRLGTTN